MKLKKIIASLLIVAALCAVSIAGTLAYFTDEVTTRNVITSGNVAIVLNEKTTGGLDFPAEGIDGVMPGSGVDKIVSVTNTGSGTAWIRVKVDTIIKSADGEALPLQTEDGKDVVVLNFNDKAADETDKSHKWFYVDGYWYYSVALKPGQTSSVLFDTVTFAPEMDNAYQGSEIQVEVSAQAVQVANNIPEGGRIDKIAGWPEA